MRLQYFILPALLFLLIAVFSCKDNPASSEEPPEDSNVTITLNPIDAESREVLTEATHHDTTTNEVIAVGADEIMREEDTELTIRTENDGYEPTTTKITFNHNRTVTISLRSIPEEDPDEVTVTYRIQDDANEVIQEASLTADSLSGRGPEGTIVFPFSDTETVELCGEAPWYEDDCVELTPSEDQETLLTLARETVSVSITPEIAGYTDMYAVAGIAIPTFIADNTIYELQVGDSTKSGAGQAASDRTEIAEGVTTTIEYPAGPDPIPVSLRVEYFPDEGHEFSDEDYLNVAEGETELSGDADSNFELELAHIPACRDEVDNTFSGEMDAEELGCTNYQSGEYDPDDEVELIKGLSRTGTFGNPDYEAHIADAPDERVGPAGNGPPHPATHYAMGPVEVLLQTKWDRNDDQQAAAIQLRCGPDRHNLPDEPTGISEITHNTTADGWQMMLFNGLTRHSYDGGTYCDRRIVHASKIRGEEAGDGEGRIEITNAEKEGFASRVERFFFQPEDVPGYEPIGGSNAAAKVADGVIRERDVRDPEAWMSEPNN